MDSNLGYILATINCVIGIFVVTLSIITTRRLRGGTLLWVSISFLAAGCLYLAHAAIEILGLRHELYAVTALVATLFLGFSLVIIDITITIMGVKK